MAGSALILHAGRNSTPEQRLVASIIAQAFNDMCGSASKDTSSHATASQIEARSAMHFLTSHAGEFARWRNDLCGFLYLDGDVLAERIRMILDGDLPWPDGRTECGSVADRERRARGSQEVEKKAARARELWRHLKNRL